MGPYYPLEVLCAGGDDYAHTAQQTFNDISGIMMCTDNALKSIYQTDDSPRRQSLTTVCVTSFPKHLRLRRNQCIIIISF